MNQLSGARTPCPKRVILAARVKGQTAGENFLGVSIFKK